MSVINSDLKALLEARLVAKTARLAKLYAAEDAGDGIKEYRLDTGVGNQRTEYFTPKEMGDEIDRLERQIDSINRKLRGQGIINIVLRRRGYRGIA